MEKKDKRFSIGLIIILLILAAVVFVLSFSRQSEPLENLPEIIKEKIYCPPESREADVCIQIFEPVCGFFNSKTCTEKPCTKTYSNSCSACSDEKVLYYTEGEC